MIPRQQRRWYRRHAVILEAELKTSVTIWHPIKLENGGYTSDGMKEARFFVMLNAAGWIVFSLKLNEQLKYFRDSSGVNVLASMRSRCFNDDISNPSKLLRPMNDWLFSVGKRLALIFKYFRPVVLRSAPSKVISWLSLRSSCFRCMKLAKKSLGISMSCTLASSRIYGG